MKFLKLHFHIGVSLNALYHVLNNLVLYPRGMEKENRSNRQCNQNATKNQHKAEKCEREEPFPSIFRAAI